MNQLDKLMNNNFEQSEKHRMAYAKSVAIDFLEWATGRNIEISLGVFVDNFGTYDSMEDYYELYLKSREPQPPPNVKYG